MSIVKGNGSYINGKFIKKGTLFTSKNPAQNFETVFETYAGTDLVNDAVDAARKAYLKWAALSEKERIQALLVLKKVFVRHEDEMAKAISLEMGKPIAESRTEARSLSARIDLMVSDGLKRIKTEYPTGVQGEARYHPHGVLAIIGPFNFPAHLLNAHVIPALLSGNAIVLKPSQVCPWVGEIYTKCMDEARIPSGIFNLVQGGTSVGQQLVSHPLVNGVLFTGSYKTGRAIKEALLDQPHKILALELGGKNFSVVLDDADLYQALSETVTGAILTTGQRCTATSRVLLHQSIAERFLESLADVMRRLKPSDPFLETTLFGPLASKASFDRYLTMLESAQTHLEPIVSWKTPSGGAFVTPSVHLLNPKTKEVPGYLDEELFGPDLCVEVISGLEEATNRVNESPYGLSNAIFTASQSNFEEFYRNTHVGVLNWNRSTNGACGKLPFGGVNKSGNFRAAGIDAVRYTTYPVAINYLSYGETNPGPLLNQEMLWEKKRLKQDIAVLAGRHKLESLFERFHLPADDARSQQIYLKKSRFEKLSYDAASLSDLANSEGEYYVFRAPTDTTAKSFEKIESFLRSLVDQNLEVLLQTQKTSVQVPSNLSLPRSHAYLDRLYRNNFVPREKKAAVVDLLSSYGPYLASIDEDPLVIFDAASQIASVGVGFQAGTYKKSLGRKPVIFFSRCES